MSETLPRYNFLAEHLRDHNAFSSSVSTYFWQALGGDLHL